MGECNGNGGVGIGIGVSHSSYYYSTDAISSEFSMFAVFDWTHCEDHTLYQH